MQQKRQRIYSLMHPMSMMVTGPIRRGCRKDGYRVIGMAVNSCILREQKRGCCYSRNGWKVLIIGKLQFVLWNKCCQSSLRENWQNGLAVILEYRRL